MQSEKLEKILEFIHEAEKLKKEMRHSWLSDGRQESVAEHSWRTALMALLLNPELENKIDINRALKMAVVHDISEIFTGDTPAFNIQEKQKTKEKEREFILGFEEKYGLEGIAELWLEYEEMKTPEGKFIKALDKLEVRIQHDEADMKTWNDVEYPRSQFIPDSYCEHDKTLKELNALIKEEAKNKIIQESSKNFDTVFEEAEKMKKELEKNI